MATTENTYTGNGSTTNYAFTFPYLKEADVKVTLDGIAQATTEYSFANATTLRFTAGTSNAKINNSTGAVNNSVAIKIYRDTANDDLTATFYPGAAIRLSLIHI